MSKRVNPSDKKKIELLEKIVKSSFGINAKLDYSKWDIESDKVVIRDIDWSEDLMEVLRRLREYYYVSLEPDIEESDYNLGRKKKTTYYPLLILELYVR